MLFDEHVAPGAHPLAAALGSHSCASPSAHEALHSDAAPAWERRTQQIVPAAQFAVALHASADVVLSPPPAWLRAQPTLAAEHPNDRAPPAVCDTQHTSAGIAHVAPPQFCAVALPPGRASDGFTPPSPPVAPLDPDESVPASDEASSDVSLDPPHAMTVPKAQAKTSRVRIDRLLSCTVPRTRLEQASIFLPAADACWAPSIEERLP